MEFQGWSNDDAMEELKALGYDNLDKEDDVRGYLERYVPRRRAREGRVRVPDGQPARARATMDEPADP